jgi:hypothetical protein
VSRPPGPITGPSAWRGEELRRSDAWMHTFTASELSELHRALARVHASALTLPEIGREDFPLPTLGPRLKTLRHELLHGRGFALLRGLPMERYALEDAAAIYWGIGAWFGRPRSQNARGHLLGHVRDVGYDLNDPNVRTYQTTKRQYYHTDSVDLVALLCVRKAKSGGLSSLVSSVTAYNELLSRRPDVLPTLFEPFHVDRRGEVPPGMAPWFSLPIFNWHGGVLTTIYVRRYIESAQRFPEAPRLTARQIEALDALDAVLEDPRVHLQMAFEPGDIQLVHNHQILHDRTEFEDWPDPSRKRHLLRLWLCPPDGRPLPPAFAVRYGSVTIGDRGGIVVDGTKLHAPLEVV